MQTRADAIERSDPVRREPGERPRVLVVDDDLEMRDMLEEFLGEEGFDVATAPNVLSALVALLDHRPHAVVVDWKMPALDGFQLLRNVEALAPDLPVIFISAYVRPEVAMEALVHGAFAVLSKPFPLARLLTEIRDALETAPNRSSGRARSRGPTAPPHRATH